jgi:N-acetylmuramic acid 6-phosphate etherase
MEPPSSPDPAAEFLAVAADYQLGQLDTEAPHPGTTRLAHWARHDLPAGLDALREVDRHALSTLGSRMDSVLDLRTRLRSTLDRGDRIFLCGCGATGRLSIALELFAREGLLAGAGEHNVIGFMAGGDAALIRAVERFEDHPEHGERQLRELGFRDGDLLLASTEGGETPFVIGAAEAAAGISREPPWFLYANPDVLLRAHVERSRRVLDDPRLRKLNLAVGPMALSGSTRMQASTVIMAAIGHAMGPGDPAPALDRWRAWACGSADWSFLAPFTAAEAEVWEAGDHVVYEPGPYGITVLTDTTERSPTFTLPPFERAGADEPCSGCYLHLPETGSPEEAWRALLRRDPRPLEWGTLRHLTDAAALLRFDFSRGVPERRRERCGRPQHVFRLDRTPEGIRWRFRGLGHVLPVPPGIDRFGEHLFLKLLLNAHSTLVMGRLGRYEDNLMTHVAPNNFKLIDRAVRYSRLLLLRHHGLDVPYETVARVLLAEKPRLRPGEPIVLRTVDAVRRAMTGAPS